jgi:FkbM family methyltransferase
MVRVFKKLSEVAAIASSRNGRRAMRHWRPFSIASWYLTRGLAAEESRFKTVIDGGANVGQFARAVAGTFDGARIFSVEPLPEIAKQLRENMADCSRVKVLQTCLGNEDGTIKIRQNSYSQASSILPMTAGADQGQAELKEIGEIEVPIARLDTLLKDEKLESPVLLKLDLQGYELEALKGATSVLSQCDYVLVETVFARVYEGEPLFEDIMLFLKDAGFRFIRPLNFLRDLSGRIIQMDALFGRRPAH